MQKLTLLTTLALFILILGCAREEPELNTAVADAQAVIQLAQERVAEVERQLELEEAEVAFRGNTVVLPAGSTDGDLADAIAQAGNNGTVIVASGDHFETGTVIIDKRVRIQGEEGAKLYVDVSGPGFQHDPALYVKDVNNVRITGLELRPQGAAGNTGILVEDGNRTWIQNNRIIGFGFAVWLYGADNGRILDNYVEGLGMGAWWTVVVQKGKNVIVRGNEVTKAQFGIFLSDKNGTAYQNDTYECDAGLFLCTAQFSSLPDGTPIFAPEPCNDWVITGNYSHDNLYGYMAQDGAFENLIVQNASADNSNYDIALRGTITFGSIIFPTSRDNQVITVGPYADLIVKDCGVNNTVVGGILVDTSVDPCP